MKLKLIILNTCLLAWLSPDAQVFEKEIYPTANSGEVILRESIITQDQSADTYCAAGYYFYNQASGGYYRPVLYNRDASGTTNFDKSYLLNGPSSGTYNGKSFAVAEDSVSGFITVGSIGNYGSNTVPGGSDILLIKYNSSGTITACKRIDLGYEETGYDIISKNSTHNRFYICGTAKRSTGSSEAFIAEIDRNLNVIWITRMALKISTGQTNATIHSLVVDGSGNIWGAGSLLPSGSLNTDFLLVKLNSSGTYQYAERFYTGTDREVLFDIHLASNGKLLLTGRSTTGLINPTSRIFVGKYTPSTRTLSVTKLLRTPEGNNYKNNTGYEIIETEDPATGDTEYFVAGSSAGRTSGIADGIIYNLNASFSPQWQVLFEANSNIELFDIDFIDDSGSGYLNLSGYYKNTATYNAGYDIKCNMNGYTGCSDSYNRDTLSISLSIDTLVDSIYTDYDLYSVSYSSATLSDSISCEDEDSLTNNQTQRLTLTSKSGIYPNPATKNQSIMLHETNPVEKIVIYSSTGKMIYQEFKYGEKEITIDTRTMNSGLYIIEIWYVGAKPEKQKLIITE